MRVQVRPQPTWLDGTRKKGAEAMVLKLKASVYQQLLVHHPIGSLLWLGYGWTSPVLTLGVTLVTDLCNGYALQEGSK
jgi:hypothetical protein